MYNIEIKELRINKSLPFTPNEEQVIYIEDEYDFTINRLLNDNFENISSCLKKKNKEFVYIPHVIANIEVNSHYYNPSINEKEVYNDMTTSDVSNLILSYCIDGLNVRSGLIRYKEVRGDYYIFSLYVFEENLSDTDFLINIEVYSSLFIIDFWNPCPVYLYPENPDNNADFDFDEESKQLIKEIRERIEALERKGINELILKSILSVDSVKLSRLVITKEYKIILPDYDNLEITMYPLPKAVFILFLNHPEGILFKNLPDYRDELIAIYKGVSGRESIEGMEKSIDDVVNPTLNSINEKCSRIREAFLKHFDEPVAKHYFITGTRATPKKISLARELITLEDMIIKADIEKTPFEYEKHEHHNKRYSIFDESDDMPY